MPQLLSQRYQRLFNHPDLGSWLDRGGRVFVAIDRRPFSEVEHLLALGHRHLAGKYLQVNARLASSLPPPCRHQITLHHYGHLQRNKASLASHHCEAIESLDRPALALRLRHVLDQAPHPPRLRSVLIQINLGREPQKSGVDPDHADALVALARDLALPLTGVMAIPPRHQPPVPHFRWLRHFADRHHLPDVHMGMSDDFPLAIQAGATAIRIGRLLFDHQP